VNLSVTFSGREETISRQGVDKRGFDDGDQPKEVAKDPATLEKGRKEGSPAVEKIISGGLVSK